MNLEIGLGAAAAAAALTMAAVLLPACAAKPAAPEPERVVVQHLLVSFGGKLQGRPLSRRQDEAQARAADLYQRARHGEDFDHLVEQYTDDRHPGIYVMVNRGRTPGAGEYGRDQMAPGFGDTAFALAVGEVGLCAYDNVKSPYGWHVIKRIE